MPQATKAPPLAKPLFFQESSSRLPMPTLASSPVRELILRLVVVVVLSPPLAFALAMGVQSQKEGTPSKDGEPVVLQAQPSATPSAKGYFPYLGQQAGPSLHEISSVLKNSEIVANMQPVDLKSFLTSSGRLRLLMVEVQGNSGHYAHLCKELPISCMLLALVPPAQTNIEKLEPLNKVLPSVPTLRLVLPVNSSSIAAAPIKPGLYIFDQTGKLIWFNVMFYGKDIAKGDEAVELVLRTALSMACPQSGLQEPVDNNEGRSASSGEADGGIANRRISLGSLASTVISVQNPNSKTSFAGTWAVAYARDRKKPMLLIFWATWCGPCIEELPELEALAKKYPAVLFVGLIDDPNTQEKRDRVGDLLKPYPTLSAQYFTADNKIFRQTTGAVDVSFPAFALFDARGKFIQSALGTIKKPETLALLEEGLRKVSEVEGDQPKVHPK